MRHLRLLIRKSNQPHKINRFKRLDQKQSPCENTQNKGCTMKIKTSILEVHFVTDDDGEVIAGPFIYPEEAGEWIEENDHD